MLSVSTFSVYDMIKRNALLFPDKTAIVDGEKSFTFSQFFVQVNSLASTLAGYGVKPRQSVAVLSMNRTEYLVLYGATSAIGAILVPLNWRLSNDELAYILKNSGSKILFCDSVQSEKAYAIKASSEKETSGFDGIIVNFDDKNLDIKSSDISDFKPFFHNSDDIFTLIYTAAVAGKPRGAALSHNNIIAANLQTSLTMKIDQSDIYLNMLPLFHITGMNLSLAVMQMGGKNVLMEKFNAQEALSTIDREKVTVMGSFPPILVNLMDELDRFNTKEPDKTNSNNKAEIRKDSAVYDISSLKNIVGIDSPATICKFTEKISSKFWILYGQCETSGFVTLSDASECPGSAGRQCGISNMAIVDASDVVLPCGQSGEIAVRGPLVFQGFWRGSTNDAEILNCCNMTKEELYDTSTIRNGWHHTGDVGHVDSKGYLWFEGRKPEKELIKPGGENVYPAEVESVILEHPDIEETSVIGVPDPKFGEGVKAVCKKKSDSDLTAKELIEFVGSRIARYKKPGYVQFVESLPKNSDGSIDRNKVKELYGN
ncbi:MAG: AMP-binding protein [Desulfamplus sp.]|nr:AMP-binding protein [Desulfamplus sp.]